MRSSDDLDAVYMEWRNLVTSHGVSGKKSHDARLVAAMKVHGVSHLLTFNTDDFKRFPGIVTINPSVLEPLAKLRRKPIDTYGMREGISLGAFPVMKNV